MIEKMPEGLDWVDRTRWRIVGVASLLQVIGWGIVGWEIFTPGRDLGQAVAAGAMALSATCYIEATEGGGTW